MSQPLVLIALVLAAAFGVFLIVRMPSLMHERSGKVLLLLALGLMPVVLMQVGVSGSLEKSTSRDFCSSCHEMQVYETSLHIDDSEFIPAVHFQNGLVPPATACYTCHTDYTMYGSVSAKWNGLKHVVTHYLGEVPEPGKIALYSPYPNANCLQCHKGMRRFEQKRQHTSDGVTLDLLYSNQKSCLTKGCHDLAHAIADIGSQDLWGEPRFPVPAALIQVKPELDDDIFGDEAGETKAPPGDAPAAEADVDALWDDDPKPDAGDRDTDGGEPPTEDAQ